MVINYVIARVWILDDATSRLHVNEHGDIYFNSAIFEEQLKVFDFYDDAHDYLVSNLSDDPKVGDWYRYIVESYQED